MDNINRRMTQYNTRYWATNKWMAKNDKSPVRYTHKNLIKTTTECNNITHKINMSWMKGKQASSCNQNAWQINWLELEHTT